MTTNAKEGKTRRLQNRRRFRRKNRKLFWSVRAMRLISLNAPGHLPYMRFRHLIEQDELRTLGKLNLANSPVLRRRNITSV